MDAQPWPTTARDAGPSSSDARQPEPVEQQNPHPDALHTEIDAARRALRAPGAAAVSGIVFSLLLSVSLILIRLAMPTNPRDAGIWLSNPALENSVQIALSLVPFAGVAFLWFIGVVRDRMGTREDRLFATVYLGSGLLFVAMLFVAAAMGAGLMIGLASASGTIASSDAWRLGRAVTLVVMMTYAMRMAAVFMISTASIALRIAIMPRWIVVLGYLCALILLVSSGLVPGVELLFPAWVLLVSVYLLVVRRRLARAEAAGLALG